MSGQEDCRTINKSIEETRQYHRQYLRAINSPLRRRILNALKGGQATMEELESRLELDAKALSWHLSVLEQGFCVEKRVREGRLVYELTKEGEVINYLDKQ